MLTGPVSRLYAGGLKISLAAAVTDCPACRRPRAVKIHFVYSDKFYLARNRPSRILAAYNVSSRERIARHHITRRGQDDRGSTNRIEDVWRAGARPSGRSRSVAAGRGGEGRRKR